MAKIMYKLIQKEHPLAARRKIELKKMLWLNWVEKEDGSPSEQIIFMSQFNATSVAIAPMIILLVKFFKKASPQWDYGKQALSNKAELLEQFDELRKRIQARYLDSLAQ